MGSSIFGTPITVATLRAMPEYQGSNSISQKDRAKVALEKMNAEGKAMDARNFLEKLQTRFAGSGDVSTMCMIYNATGETMTFVIARDWKGRVCESAYPMIVANGQWGVFLHGQYYNQDKNSRAGIVYSALNNQGNEKHWFMGFSNSTQGSYNQVYVEIREPGHYEQPESKGIWQALDTKLSKGNLVHQEKEGGGFTCASIGNTAEPVFEAIMTLPEAK
ncbi:23 kDa jasmonate-induced protein [Beta vulgaris subsp. vulgaris]|uniref:23 kDa jasmonate-induced protein n=1 Tax=Beta vulgaris subsp. vulgaris TaxID=3555 RepID=UPI0025476CB6|nr:23 kDa jasmonate-induced protein [Beta vulgaris subsp. vulgaris]